MQVMDLSKGNRDIIKNSKANEMIFNHFNITILLMLVTQSKQIMNKPMVLRRNNHIIARPI